MTSWTTPLDATNMKIVMPIFNVFVFQSKRSKPLRVKRPLNAFMVWSLSERRKLSQLEPDLKHMEISKRYRHPFYLFFLIESSSLQTLIIFQIIVYKNLGIPLYQINKYTFKFIQLFSQYAYHFRNLVTLLLYQLFNFLKLFLQRFRFRLGKRWQSLSAEERLPFIQEACRLKCYHIQQYPDYKFQPRKKIKFPRGSNPSKKTACHPDTEDNASCFVPIVSSPGISGTSLLRDTSTRPSRDPISVKEEIGTCCWVVAPGICQTLQTCKSFHESLSSTMSSSRLNIRMVIDSKFKETVTQLRLLSVADAKKRDQQEMPSFLLPDSPPCDDPLPEDSMLPSAGKSTDTLVKSSSSSSLDSFTSTIIKSEPDLLTTEWTPDVSPEHYSDYVDASLRNVEPVDSLLSLEDSGLTDLNNIITDILCQLNK